MSDGSASGSGDWWSLFGKVVDYAATRDQQKNQQEQQLELERIRNAAPAAGVPAGGFPLSLPSWFTAPMSSPGGTGNAAVVSASTGSLNLSAVIMPVLLLVGGAIALKAFKVI